MKIAVLAPVAWRTPPYKYGPWEQVASNVTEGLVARGLDVTLFATANSETNGKLEAIVPKGYAEDPEADAKVAECMHISHLMERADKFDLIHNHFDFLPLTYSRLIRIPMVTTIHGFSSPRIVPVYKRYNDIATYVSISNVDRNPTLKYAATVYNGIKSDDFSFQNTPSNYLLYFGRIHPDKGTREAIELAKKADYPLIISGLIQDERYFHEEIEPHIDGNMVVFVGNNGPEERNMLLGNALALLHLINFEEPFGLSVAEAMMCGTPVIATRRGAMPELIRDGETGFLVNSVEEGIQAIKKIPTLSRQRCREWSLSKFTINKMVDGYLKVYGEVLNHRL